MLELTNGKLSFLFGGIFLFALIGNGGFPVQVFYNRFEGERGNLRTQRRKKTTELFTVVIYWV